MTRLDTEDISWLKMYDLAGHVSDYIPFGDENGNEIQVRRLRFYQIIAQSYAQWAVDMDELAEKIDPGKEPFPLVKDDRYKEGWIAEIIRKKDPDLLPMLQARKIIDKKDPVCRIYARMIMDHEEEKDVENLLKILEKKIV